MKAWHASMQAASKRYQQFAIKDDELLAAHYFDRLALGVCS